MTSSVLPDPSTPFSQRVERRLRDEIVVWLTTSAADGTPQPNPVWFVLDGEGILVYNRPDAHRLTHVVTRSGVALHFDGNGRGGDIVVITGRAELMPDQPPPHEHPAYLTKYRDHMIRVSGTPEAFSRQYPVALRVVPLKVRGH